MVICGAISVYNETSLPKSISVQPFLVKNSALMQGFIVSNYKLQILAIKHLEHGYRKETDLHRNSGRRFWANPTSYYRSLMENKGKMVVKIWHPDRKWIQ
jgi:NADPH-dependent curcumin reductase CurA